MKVASRFFLPVEMFLGLKLLVLAITGGFGGGTLYRALLADGENIAWFLAIAATGLPVFVLAAYEWFCLRHASEDMILRSVGGRSFSAFLGTTTWVAALGYVVSHNMASQSMYFVLLAPVAATFHAWSFVENLKVKYALDCRYATSKLVFHR